MIRVFTTNGGGTYAGEDLTRQYERWLASFKPNIIKVESIHTNSNENGWMLTILYSIVR
jgi:hypothetical protein